MDGSKDNAGHSISMFKLFLQSDIKICRAS